MDKDSATHEVNILHSIGLQNGGLCPAKVEKYFTTLGVDYRLHRTNLGNLQKRVGKTIETMATETAEEALRQEVAATKEKGDIVDGVAQLGVCGDAAWPNRGSGRSYASFCGMFVVIGAITKKVLSATIFDKMCAVCELAERQDPPVAPCPHDCWRGARGINCESDASWRGSSKAMEAEGAVLCVKSIGESDCGARVAFFTADEDSNMISAINDVNGLVPAKLRPVRKRSDQNHLQKIVYKDLDAGRTARKWKGATLSKKVIDYLNKNYRYIVRSVAVVEDLPGFETMEQKAEWLSGAIMNIVDHAFNIDPTHENCRRFRVPLPGGSFHCWCGVETKFLQRDEPAGYYEAVKDVFRKFAAIPTLMKQMHNTDTNVNESVNGMVVKGYLPCGKAQQNGQSGVYAWACCHTICSKNMGHVYRQELCRRFGLPVTEAMRRLDAAMDEKRTLARESRGSHSSKTSRMRKRLHKADRNGPPKKKVKATYETGGDLDKDCFGETIVCDPSDSD
ncbi:hypothetical protein CYMTET_19501 [Cymbomonas tetramitiformis]|uniref:Mutator-like transposase domain-containing protein n=1 Tax=Cymbomonas tetramitiformis TaxID=36881 RepID=A0AAE0L548_9CHLO|nr:hypothetical protein CYMTET_19501 [Cymbomonas tetramitiformis]